MPLEIFRGGEVQAADGSVLQFTADDLAAIAAGYDPSRHEAPLVIGHPASDDPAYGWVKGLKVKDGVLLAELDQVEPAIKELVGAGRYKKISASFYRPTACHNPTPGQWYLRHVGLLGAQPPAIKGLRAIQFAAGDDGIVNFECARPAQREERTTMTQTDLAKREAELAKREAELAERERKTRRSENEAFCQGLLKEGRLTPGHRAAVLDLMDHLDPTATVEFGEGAGKVSGTILGRFKEVLATMPPAIHFGELTAPDGADVQGRSPAAIAEAAVTFQEERRKAGKRVSAAEAVRQVIGQA